MTSKRDPVRMRVNIAGYAGEAVSLFAAYDPDTDMLLVAQTTKYEPGPRDGYLKITNQARDSAHDALFTEEETRDAITAYFELDALRLMKLAEKVQRANPSSKIERDGMDERGIKYRVAPDMNCAQVAVLVAAYYAGKQRGIAASMDAMEEFMLLTI